MKIFFDASGSVPFTSTSLQERPLGGTETAVICISDELAQLGHHVSVKSSHRMPSGVQSESGVFYVGSEDTIRYSEYDVWVSVQHWRLVPFGVSQLESAPKLILWTGDGAEQFSNYGIGDKRVVEALSGLFVVSEFHKKSLCEASLFPEEATYIVPNGASEAFLSSGEQERDVSKLIYHAAPYRGLNHLLRYISEFEKSGVEISLDIFSDMKLYAREGQYRGPHADVIRKLQAVYGSLENVNFNQTVPQNELPTYLRQASIFAYPCTVPEVFCMTLLEAMMSGVVPVVRDIGALSELVDDADLVVSGEPQTQEFDSRFMSKISELLNDGDLRKEKSVQVQKKAQQYLWSQSAKVFEAALKKVVEK